MRSAREEGTQDFKLRAKKKAFLWLGDTLIKNGTSHLVRTATLGLRTVACDTSQFDTPIVKPQGRSGALQDRWYVRETLACWQETIPG